MYKVMLVDDEEAVTKALSKSIHWEQMNLTLFATARSSEEALGIAQKTAPDIVITDIRMEGAGGLELCRQLRAMNPNIQLIIISGYAEFSYAQRGFLYGAIGYCLKPLEYSEVSLYLSRAVKELQDLQGYFTHDSLFEAIQSENAPAIKDYLQRFGLSADQFYLSVSTGEEVLPVQNVLQDPFLHFPIAHAQHVYITTEKIPVGWITDFVAQREGISFGASNQSVVPQNFLKEIQFAQTAAFHFFIRPGYFVCYTLNESRAVPYLHAVHQAVFYQSGSALIAALHRIQDQNSMSMFTMRSVQKLCGAIFSSGLSDIEDDGYFHSYGLLIRRFGSFEYLLQYLMDSLRFHSESSEDSPRMSNTNLLKMMLYINTHYNEELSVSKLAGVLHLNANYLSQVFKKENGVTFTKYVNNLRIEKAKEMLISRDISISDVADSVGFHDYFYFLKVFKRIVGKTPNQFRRHDRIKPPIGEEEINGE